jgi:hypothetical protein
MLLFKDIKLLLESLKHPHSGLSDGNNADMVGLMIPSGMMFILTIPSMTYHLMSCGLTLTI